MHAVAVAAGGRPCALDDTADETLATTPDFKLRKHVAPVTLVGEPYELLTLKF